MSEHGTTSSYRRGGCRCPECTAAVAAYGRQIRQKRRSVEVPAHLHGTSGGYRNWSCRCERCRAAQADCVRAERAARRNREVHRG